MRLDYQMLLKSSP